MKLNSNRNRIVATAKIFFAILCMTMVASCAKDGDAPSKEPNIVLGPHSVATNAKWVSNGDTFEVTLSDISFSSSVDDVRLSSIEMEVDGKIVSKSRWTPDIPIQVKVNDWKHGVNTLDIYAIFTGDNQSVRVKLFSPKITVFNEVPKFGLGANLLVDIIWEAGSFKYYDQYLYDSQDMILTIPYFSILDPLSGKLFDSFNLTFTPTIVEDKTNFDATLDVQEIRWFEPDGPTGNEGKISGRVNTKIYVTMIISGIHEGIDINVKTNAVYYLSN